MIPNQSAENQPLDKDDRTILLEEINNVFAKFYGRLDTGCIFIEVFRGGITKDIDKAKEMIRNSANTDEISKSVINSLTTIAELNGKSLIFKEIIDNKIRCFAKIHAEREHYNEQSAALPNPAIEKDAPTAVGEHTQREIDRNAGMSSQGSWCSIL